MSLADELLADFDDDEVPEDECPNKKFKSLNDEESNHETNVDELSLDTPSKLYLSVRSLTKVIGSDDLKRIIEEINSRQSNDCMY